MRLRAARVRALRAGDAGARALAAGAIGAMIGIVFAGIFLGVQELAVEVVLWGAPGIAVASAAYLERPDGALFG